MDQMHRMIKRMVTNLSFEWNYELSTLMRSVSPYMWGLFRRNLYRFLRLQDENPYLYERRLAEVLVESEFHRDIERVEQAFDEYMNPQETIVSRDYPEIHDKTVAYFSMEYGIETLRIYSGGLGILSGDHLRGASDLGLKLVGVGLFYLLGYYEQVVSTGGDMSVIYDPVVPPKRKVREFLPVEPVKQKGTNKDLVIEVTIGKRRVKARVWKARVGRVELLLLDSSLKENHVHDRHITRRLYASEKQHDKERQRRLEQEILLGIGGVRALREAGYEPSVYHLNEGHVALANFEIIRHLMQERKMTFEKAREYAAGMTGFTTHTPVPEGNETFDENLVRRELDIYLKSYLSPEQKEFFFNCARNRNDAFDMTKLSLLLAGAFRNGVSALHGEVCRQMWSYAWGMPTEKHAEVGIGHITNSVHVPYWQKPMLRQMIEEHGGLDHVHDIPDEKIWALHWDSKEKLVAKVRERYAYQLIRDGVDLKKVNGLSHDLLDSDSFMIGFARRFAGYKRVTLLLEDEDRLFRFLENTYRTYGKAVNIIFAGKPHPNNTPGRDRIRYITDVSKRLAVRCRERDFRAQVFFAEGYDIDLARYLVGGADIWLNNPIRPLEASGTSGMKAGMNGVLNVSVPDGWVPEGVESGRNGWLFGKGGQDTEKEDRAELFDLLERQILPIYFDRKNEQGLELPWSPRWVHMMKESIISITRQFNTDRMLRDYTEKMYLPAVRFQTGKEKVTA